jgi:hypothetical protein
MTGQMSDILFYLDEEYKITGVKGEDLFHPGDVGLTPYSNSTACWRGYVASYEIDADELRLAGLLINTEDKADINGIEAERLTESRFSYQFAHLNLKIPFNGSILIGTDFIQSMYIHMGFQKPITYEKVIELKFKNGDLLSSEDISLKIKEIRENSRNSPSRPSSEEDIGKWIENSFSLHYD